MYDRSIIFKSKSTKGYPLMAQTPKNPAAPRKAGPARVTGQPASKASAKGPDAVAMPAAKAPAPKTSAPKTPTTKAPALKTPTTKTPAPKTPAPKASAAKPRARPAAKAKPAPEAQVAAAASALVSAVGETIALRKKDLVDRVVAASGAKKKQVKDIVAHTLKVLGDAIGKGEQLHLPPFRPAKVADAAVPPAKPRKAAKPLAVPEKGR
jgi:nucleoid DNA-binding protein